MKETRELATLRELVLGHTEAMGTANDGWAAFDICAAGPSPLKGFSALALHRSKRCGPSPNLVAACNCPGLRPGHHWRQ